jgi:Na+/H+ antiporter NhaD/arsenite permease-like protein
MESLNTLATTLFVVAILHTFLVKQFQHLAKRFPEGSAGENLFHLLGEVEVVFGLWAAVMFTCFALKLGLHPTIEYLEKRDFTEPAFVFVIMTVCATRPILVLANGLINLFSRLIPLPRAHAFYFSCLTIGPFLGSLITEPAAMTVTALVLLDRFYKKGLSTRLKYATLGLLFVNVSIGGVFTPYAAPPVLMVAGKWGWDLHHMLWHFGWKSGLSLILSTGLVLFRYRKEFSKLQWAETAKQKSLRIPVWIFLIHVLFLAGIILAAHHMVIFIALFLFFLGLVTVTREYQTTVKLREGLLVGFFLAGLVVLGAPQKWWLEILLAKLDTLALYLGAVGLTAITDNAALTFLGSQVESLTDASKYALVAGAVVGGGLTVIANAPNPAGYGILNSSFGSEGISPGRLFMGALMPTIIAALCFWLPTFIGSY